MLSDIFIFGELVSVVSGKVNWGNNQQDQLSPLNHKP